MNLKLIFFLTLFITILFIWFTYPKDLETKNRVGNDVGGMVEVK